MQDDFGDRMKAYEAIETSRRLDPRLPIYVRIDGRAFSTLTRNFKKPFDIRMIDTMGETTSRLVQKTHALIGFTQSDEINLVYRFLEGSEPLFGGKSHKLTSVLASLATASFHQAVRKHFGWFPAQEICEKLPHFDARVLNLPNEVEASNAFLWRAMDAHKNAIFSAARAEFSPKQLFKADQTKMKHLLKRDRSIDFDTHYPDYFKYGMWFRRYVVERELTELERMKIPEQHRPDPGILVMRHETRRIDMPFFRDVANRVNVIFDGHEPKLHLDTP